MKRKQWKYRAIVWMFPVYTLSCNSQGFEQAMQEYDQVAQPPEILTVVPEDYNAIGLVFNTRVSKKTATEKNFRIVDKDNHKLPIYEIKKQDANEIRIRTEPLKEMEYTVIARNIASEYNFETDAIEYRFRGAGIPYVTSISFLTENGSYTDDDVISIIVQFNEPVKVKGHPYIELNAQNSVAKARAKYVAKVSDDTLQFDFTVGYGHYEADLDVRAADALKMGKKGRIYDASGTDANVRLPKPGSEKSLSANYDISVASQQAPAIITYSTTSPTNRNVNAYVEGLEKIKILNNNGNAIYIFKDNGSFTFQVQGENGQVHELVAEVTWIDRTPPDVSLQYSPASKTNQNVTATLTSTEPLVIINNGGSATYTFENNSSFTFFYSDTVGNEGSITATVDWIDRIAPSGVVSYSILRPTESNVTATLSAIENITVLNNGGSAQYEFTQNGDFTFQYRDEAGNENTLQAAVTWIHRLQLSSISGSITESGGQGTFTIALDSAPKKDVYFDITSSNESEGTVSPASMTFTSSNWNVPQTVTVTGVDDIYGDGDQTFYIRFSKIVSLDTDFNGLDPSDLAVTNLDNESPGIAVSAISGSVAETGTTATFTIVLLASPTGTVIIDLSSSDTTEGTVSPSQVTFDGTNWFSQQTVTVTGVDDLINDGNITFTIITSPATGTATAYNGKDPDDVTVVNIDND